MDIFLLILLLGIALVLTAFPAVGIGKGSGRDDLTHRVGEVESAEDSPEKHRERFRKPAAPPRRYALAVAGVLVFAIAAAVLLLWPQSERAISSRIAVLPFRTVGPQATYFADALTEELATRIGTVEGLLVASSEEARRLDQAGTSSGEIAEALDVRYLIEGSIALDGPGRDRRVRVAARLVDAGSSTQLWSEFFDESAEQIFSVQGRITDRIAEALNLTLGVGDRPALTSPQTENFQAYESYLEGTAHRRAVRDPGRAEAALAAFRRATELDPEFPTAWAAQASVHLWMAAEEGYADQLDSARIKLERAVRLDSTDIDVRMAQALYLGTVSLDRQAALTRYEAYEPVIGPQRRPAVMGIMRDLHWSIGNVDEALRKGEAALESDPYLPFLQLGQAALLLRVGGYSEASDLIRRSLEGGSRDPRAHRLAVLVPLLAAGDTSAAWEALGAPSDAVLGQVFGAGLLGESRAALRVFHDRLDADRLESTPQYGSEAAVVGSMLSAAILAQQQGDSSGAADRFQEVARRLSALRSAEHTLAPRFALRVRGGLAIALAGLGRSTDAWELLLETDRTLPNSEDRFLKEDLRIAMAEVSAMIGDLDGASRHLDTLLASNTLTSRDLLSVDPLWLRNVNSSLNP